MRFLFNRSISNRLFSAVVPMAFFMVSLQSCSEKVPAPFEGKSVLLISIDTCRADRVQPYSDAHAQTPEILSLVRDGVWFEDAVTPVPLTLPAHCSLLTGLHPMRHGVRNNYNYALSDDAVTLADLFNESEYATAGVVGSIIISRREGIAQGFDYFNDEFSPEAFQAVQPAVERRAEEVVASATGWLEEHLKTDPDQPFFLFTHYYDPHMLYQPPAPFDLQYADSPYDGEIAYVDRCLGSLFDFLKENDLYDDLIVVLVADHGEGLKDHQELTHGLFLYDEAVRVPFVVKLPNDANRPTNVRLQQNVSLMDVAPTLIELCGLGPVETTGVSLAPCLMKDAPIQPRNIVQETMYPLTYNWSPTYALRNQGWKYIHSPIPELYNLIDDPKETKNLYSTAGTPLTGMQAELEERLISMAQKTLAADERPVSSDRMETLASLGYAAGGTTTGVIGPDKTLPDPKEKLDVYLLVDQGLSFLARGAVQNAIDLFERAKRKDPENPTPYVNMGLAYAKMKQWDKAIELTRKAVEMSPENLIAHLQLTRIYVMCNKLQEGRPLLEAVIRDFPKSAEAHYQLGEIFLRQNDRNSALKEFELAKHWMPDMPGIDESIAKAKGE